MRFDEFDLSEGVLRSIETMNYVETTPVQEQAIPVILEGRDLIACAQTGTGKTAAYTLPLLSELERLGNPENLVKALIVVPTRELAQQIDVQFQGFSYFIPVSTSVVYGGGDGSSWEQQKRGMLMGADVVIATPGRLISHIANSGIDLSGVEYLILDEADRMLDMGFFEDIMQIVKCLTKRRQTLLFSATLPPKIRELAKQILTNPVEVNIAISKPNDAIRQYLYLCYETQKIDLVQDIYHKGVRGKSLIFASSKVKVKELAYTLKRMKMNVAAMHSDLDQEKRDQVMLDFKNGKIDALVATDIVARGIDIEDINLVINFDVPHDPEDYIHRIGRTARADADGAAIMFVNEEDQVRLFRIEKLIEKEIERLPLPEHLGKGPTYNPEAFMRRGRGAGANRGGGSGRSSGSGRGSNRAGGAGSERGSGRSSGGGRNSGAARSGGSNRGGSGRSFHHNKHRDGQNHQRGNNDNRASR